MAQVDTNVAYGYQAQEPQLLEAQTTDDMNIKQVSSRLANAPQSSNFVLYHPTLITAVYI